MEKRVREEEMRRGRKGREEEERKKGADRKKTLESSIHWFISQRAEKTDLGQAEYRSQELQPDFPEGYKT